MIDKNSRREFLKKTSVAAAGLAGLQSFGAPAIGKVLGANDKIRVGFIGIGNRGSQLLQGFLLQKDVQVAAFSDVYEPYLFRDRSKVSQKIFDSIGQGRVPRMDETLSKNIARYTDFRKLLEQKDLDAVCIATPDHWHAVQTIMACQAGLDVYCEKPLTNTIHEGRQMVNAAKKFNRIVQVGLHRRASTGYHEIHKVIQSGKIGQVTTARAYRISNMFPAGIGQYKGETPPQGFNWDMWLGPRAFVPFQYNMAPYKFRWWSDYSSQMGNWGVHYCDAIRWMLDVKAPVAINAFGGKYAIKDDRTIPDTMEANFELPNGANLVFGQYEASGLAALQSGEIEFRGTLGNIYPTGDGSSYKVVPTVPGQFSKLQSPVKEEIAGTDDGTGNQSMTNMHIRNFCDCIKSRNKPNCDLEEGHRSTTFAHLANISLALKQRLEWDGENERFINNNEANKLLHYEYRKPWSLNF